MQQVCIGMHEWVGTVHRMYVIHYSNLLVHAHVHLHCAMYKCLIHTHMQELQMPVLRERARVGWHSASHV